MPSVLFKTGGAYHFQEIPSVEHLYYLIIDGSETLNKLMNAAFRQLSSYASVANDTGE